MRLHLLLSKVDPNEIQPPSKCVDPACRSRKFRLHQPVKKVVRDTVYHEASLLVAMRNAEYMNPT